MIALLVSGQPTLALEIPGNTFTDRGYQRVELFAPGGVDPMKSQLTIALGRKDTVNKERGELSSITVMRGILPFILADIVRLALLIMIPALALYLPSQI